MYPTPLAVSIAEAVKLTGNSRTAVYAAIKAGALVARKRGRRTLILYPDLEAWLQNLPEARRDDASSGEWPGEHGDRP